MRELEVDLKIDALRRDHSPNAQDHDRGSSLCSPLPLIECSRHDGSTEIDFSRVDFVLATQDDTIKEHNFASNEHVIDVVAGNFPSDPQVTEALTSSSLQHVSQSQYPIHASHSLNASDLKPGLAHLKFTRNGLHTPLVKDTSDFPLENQRLIDSDSEIEFEIPPVLSSAA